MSHQRRRNLAQARTNRTASQMPPPRRASHPGRASRLRNASAVLSDQDIWHEIKHGNISIHPFHRHNLNYSSYCVTIGENYYRANDSLDLLNPWNKKQVLDYWEGPYKAVRVDDDIFKKSGIPIGKKAIILSPGSVILTHTQEFIGGLNHVATFLQARTSMARAGVTVCGDCGWGDIGQINRHLLILRNHSKTPVILPVGARIGHIIFFYTGVPKFFYKGATQTTENVYNMTQTWEPSHMLPKISERRYNIKKKKALGEYEFLDPKYVNDPVSGTSSDTEDEEPDTSPSDGEEMVSLD